MPGTDLSTEGLAYFETLLGEHVRADNRLGPQHVVGLVEHQAHQLNIAARNARGPARRGVIALAFRFREFLGWLQQDSGRYAAAMESTDRALDMATELGDPLWNAYLLMRKSNIATDADDPASAAALADAALRAASGAPPKLHAVILRQKANAHAALGDPRECATAVDRSFGALDREESEWDPIVGYCTEPYVVMEAANCWTELRRPKRALHVFEQADAEWPDALRRDKGLYLVAAGHRSRTSRRRRQGMQRGDGRRSDGELDPFCPYHPRTAPAPCRARPLASPARRSSRLHNRSLASSVEPHRREAPVSQLLSTATSREEADRAATVAVLPIGSFEQHGDASAAVD